MKRHDREAALRRSTTGLLVALGLVEDVALKPLAEPGKPIVERVERQTATPEEDKP